MVEGHQKWQNWTPAYYLSNKKSEHVVVHNFLRRIQKNVFWEGVRCLSSGSSWNSDVPAFTPSQNLHILVRDGQFSGGMHPQNSSTRGNKGLSEMPKFWQFFLICCQFFGRSGTVKNTDRETWNRKTGTFSIDVSARPLHTRQLSMQIQRMTREGRYPAASSCQKIGTRDPNAGLPIFWPPQIVCKKVCQNR